MPAHDEVSAGGGGRRAAPVRRAAGARRGAGRRPPTAPTTPAAFATSCPPARRAPTTPSQLAQFQATGARPAALGRPAAALHGPALRVAEPHPRRRSRSYFKDATFGVKPGDVASVEHPRPGVTVVRDKPVRRPARLRQTRADVMFGAGYAGAAGPPVPDGHPAPHRPRGPLLLRRRLGRQPRDGPHAVGARALHRGRPAVADRQGARSSTAPRAARSSPTSTPTSPGINQYISEALLNPAQAAGRVRRLRQAAPALEGRPTSSPPASLIGGIFGKGGGREVDSALVLQAFAAALRHGQGADGVGATSAPRTTPRRPPRSPKPLPLPDELAVLQARARAARPGLGDARRAASPAPAAGAAAAARLRPRRLDLGSQLAALLHGGGRRTPPTGSSSPREHSTTGHPIAVMGPQVGYYVPQILMEIDLHGPGIDARGAAFPGRQPRTSSSATAATTPGARPPPPPTTSTPSPRSCARTTSHYLYKGECRAMERLERTNSWTPNAGDQTPPGSETLTAYRTVHGIVYARGTVGGRKVAFVQRPDHLLPRGRQRAGLHPAQRPQLRPTSPQRFQQAASTSTSPSTGPTSTPSTSPTTCPAGTRSGAEGTRPTSRSWAPASSTGAASTPNHTMSVLPFAEHPNAIDPAYLVSWNGKQAPGWAAADDQYSYGPLQRMQLIHAPRARGAAQGRGKMAHQRSSSARWRSRPPRTSARRPAVADAAPGARPAAATPALRDGDGPPGPLVRPPAATAATSTRTGATSTTTRSR